MTPKRIALIATATAALLVGFYLWWSSPERVLKRRTADFLETVSIEIGRAHV